MLVLRIDTTVPAAPLMTAPADGASVGFSFTLTGTAEPGTVAEVFENGVSRGTSAVAYSGEWERSVNSVTGSSVTFTVRTRDLAGNISASSAPRTFYLGAAPPDTTISSATTGANASFSFTSTKSPATFQCRLDGPGQRRRQLSVLHVTA